MFVKNDELKTLLDLFEFELFWFFVSYQSDILK